MTTTPVVEAQTRETMLPRPFTVTGVRSETDDTTTLDLEPLDGDGLGYAPGQFTMVYVPGVGEVPISIAGGGPDEATLVHTVRGVGAVTNAICALSAGDQIGIRGPYGRGWPMDTAAGGDLLIVGGGIGLAPLRAVVRHAFANRDGFGALALLYGSRSPADILYEAELHEWRARFDIEVEVTVDRSAPGWYGDVGLVTHLLDRVEYDPPETTAMVCGPEIMMKVVGRFLEETGVEAHQVAVSLERNMQCAVGFCGHCQFGPDFVCRDGPVFSYADVASRMRVEEF